MDDNARLRYSRHLLLDGFEENTQERLLAAHALVIGAGGLGSAASLYLAGAGVGRITLVDDDRVDLTNLQRQIAHTTDRVGQPKVESARQALLALNPTIEVTALAERAEGERLSSLVAAADVVIDASDNFATRQAVNAACVRHRKPLVFGAAIRFESQLSLFDTRDPALPCYACAFPPTASLEETRCATLGVFSPLVGIVGALQAAEALKVLTGVGDTLAGRLVMLDAHGTCWDEFKLARDPHCPVCAERPAA